MSRPIPVVIESVTIGNDHTDSLEWFIDGRAAICYEEGEHQGIHFVVVDDHTPATDAVLRDMLEMNGLYEEVQS